VTGTEKNRSTGSNVLGGVFFCAGNSANIASGKPSGDDRSKCLNHYFALVASVQHKNPEQMRFALDFQISTEATKAADCTMCISHIFEIYLHCRAQFYK
jgi:hypothetical protein